MSLTRVAGKEITTLEGFDPAEVERYAQCFATCGALQCGFCTPGIVVRAKAQIDKKGSALTREEMARHLGGHLCRCTGYVKILDAIEALAQGTSPKPEANGGIGSRGVKYEAVDLAVGRRNYIDDMCAEWGYVSLDELLSIKIPPIGHKLERNFYFTPCTLDSIQNK